MTLEETLRMLHGDGVHPTFCALCGRAGPMLLSHIVPKFVFDWLKDSSGTGRIRTGFRP
jgi:hypothetical protein